MDAKKDINKVKGKVFLCDLLEYLTQEQLKEFFEIYSYDGFMRYSYNKNFSFVTAKSNYTKSIVRKLTKVNKTIL